MSDFLVLVTDDAVQRMREGGRWGQVTFQVSFPDNVGAVIAVSHGTGPVMPTPLKPVNHFLRSGDSQRGHRWFRVAPWVHTMWWRMRHIRDVMVPLNSFKDAVEGGWRSPSADGAYVALTYSPDAPKRFPEVGVPELVAWWVTASGVYPASLDIQVNDHGLSRLTEHWPSAQLADASIMLVGAGSIGGAAADALASYGIGRLVLVDPDRLLSHNVVRHVATAKSVGKLKVDVLKENLAEAWPATRVEPLARDVITDANLIRPLLDRVDVLLCTADGVAARRVVSHLARRAQIDAVLACVLADGAIGEILRLRPWPDHGCLVCRRHALMADGSMDPEPGLDLGYGTGTTHRPMTAVGGDLHLVGQVAAKTSVATILERRGHSDQKIFGEHALIGLRPQVGWAPPFDLDHNNEIRWLPHQPPQPGCPTCEPA